MSLSMSHEILQISPFTGHTPFIERKDRPQLVWGQSCIPLVARFNRDHRLLIGAWRKGGRVRTLEASRKFLGQFPLVRSSGSPRPTSGN